MNPGKTNFLLYGSTGFTGDLMARLAVQRGLRPILAGRNRVKIEAQARELGLDCRVFELNDAAALERAVGEVAAVLNCAGPFLYTAKPIVEACLKVGTHYLDITGEYPVFEMIVARDEQARARGVTLLPAVGFDVAPTDCLAAHLKHRLPTATHLTLAWSIKGRTNFSRGSSLTMIEALPSGGKIRHNGRLETVPLGAKTRMIDLGYGPAKVIQEPWGDVFTAFYTTGIPNIEEYMPSSKQVERLGMLARYLGPLLALAPVKNWMKRNVQKQPPGPTAEMRATCRGLVWGEVTDDKGRRAVSRLEGPEPGYTWTLITALDAVEKVLAGLAQAGFTTPGLAFGADFVLECKEVTRCDVE